MSDDEMELRRRAIQSQRWTKQAQANQRYDDCWKAQIEVNEITKLRCDLAEKRLDLAMKCIRYLAFSVLAIGIHILIQSLRAH
jgi:hypothetical protein